MGSSDLQIAEAFHLLAHLLSHQNLNGQPKTSPPGDSVKRKFKLGCNGEGGLQYLLIVSHLTYIVAVCCGSMMCIPMCSPYPLTNICQNVRLLVVPTLKAAKGDSKFNKVRSLDTTICTQSSASSFRICYGVIYVCLYLHPSPKSPEWSGSAIERHPLTTPWHTCGSVDRLVQNRHHGGESSSA